MNKKIIAIVGVVILLISIFAACAKKPTIKNNKGDEYLVATDDEGNTVLNDKGGIAVYVTDANGKYVEDENGEKQTNYIDFPNIIDGNTFENAYCKITMPKGWTLDKGGTFYKDDSENAVHLKILDEGKNENGNTISSLIEKEKSNSEPLLEELKKEYPVASMDVTDVRITSKNAPGKAVEFLIKDDSDNTIYHAYAIYFLCNGEILRIEYVCGNNDYNDTAEELLTIINEGLTIKGAAG